MGSFHCERSGDESNPGERSHAGQRAFAAWKDHRDGFSALIILDRSQGGALAQVRWPNFC
jgi:hypothetical protein